MDISLPGYMDIAGITCLSCFILCFLTIFIIGGRDYGWFSGEILGLGALSFEPCPPGTDADKLCGRLVMTPAQRPEVECAVDSHDRRSAAGDIGRNRRQHSVDSDPRRIVGRRHQ